MTELVSKLKAEGNFVDAYLVAKNNLSRNIGNYSMFQQFIDLALELAMYDIVFEERKQYVSDAHTALVMFSESAELNVDIIAGIKEVRARISMVMDDILAAEQAEMDAAMRVVQDENTTLLNQLVEIYDAIAAAKSQAAFDDALAKVSEVEVNLQKDAFTAEQENTYERLTKQYSELISKKMEEINRNELLEYNKRAVASFNDVFKAFKREPSKYKDESVLKALMTSKFFAFDTSKLFNESLVFYNHVYSLVFQETSDALKFKLTEWALNTTKLKN